LAKRSYREIFIAELTRLSKGQQMLSGNGALQNELDWDDARYNRIKQQLVDAEEIIVGRGRGGSVGLADAPGSKAAFDAFIAYSHADEAVKNALLKHLKPLTRLKLVEEWHDRKITPGDDWDKVITKKLENSDIILLLVSIDFINSEYCYDNELERAMERHEAGTAKVIPIILRPCSWSHAPFAKLQVLPEGAKAVTKWDNQDEALSHIAEGVMQAAKELSTSSKR
jgi:hypothetical protein